jgi:hypothetical protein
MGIMAGGAFHLEVRATSVDTNIILVKLAVGRAEVFHLTGDFIGGIIKVNGVREIDTHRVVISKVGAKYKGFESW